MVIDALGDAENRVMSFVATGPIPGYVSAEEVRHAYPLIVPPHA